jgi:hypothetical protein
LHIFFFLKIAFIENRGQLLRNLTYWGLLRDPKGGLVGASTSFSQKEEPTQIIKTITHFVRNFFFYLDHPSLKQVWLGLAQIKNPNACAPGL